MLDDYSSFGSTIILVGLMLLVLFAAYYTTKFLSVKTQRLTRCKHIQLLDRMLIGGGKTILLLSAGEELFLVGVTNQNISVLGTLKSDSIKPVAEEQNASVISSFKGSSGKFTDMLSRFMRSPRSLRGARAQHGESVKEDELEQMLDALKQRNNRHRGSGDGEDSST